MKQLEKNDDLLPLLKSFAPFTNIKEESIKWIIDRSEYYCYEPGEKVFEVGDPVDNMLIVTEGEYILEIEQKGVLREMGSVEGGEISGLLPFSRLKETKGIGTVLKQTKVLYFPKECFTEMVNRDYDLVQNLVGLMSDRVRDFSQLRFQNEKLMSLGKLSAGLAHELNNPASAMTRSAKELHQKLHQTPEKFKRVMRLNADDAMVDAVNDVLFAVLKKGTNNDLSTLDRNDLEDDITDWLEDNGATETEDMTETFTDYNFGTDEMEKIKKIVGADENFIAVLSWVENVLATEKLVCEIKESSNRIGELVRSVKGYSHMDKAPVREPIDVKESIVSTVIMLKHKIKSKQIKLEKVFAEDLPKINAFGGEINQIFTNIIDNALDAMENGGTLKIETYRRGHNLCIDITDSGAGIPEDIMSCIFDPFFTTKAMNEGTGMGLDIVKKIVTRNNGDIQVQSEPGKTCFTVCFPI